MHPDAPSSCPAASSRGEHRPQLDGLRFLAFLAIFVFHCNSGRFPAGQLGVPLFFALSGFLITRILLRNESGSPARDIGTFYARRILRIFPLYYAVLFALLACGQLEQPWFSFAHIYNFCAYANRAFVGRSGHFWTLAVEEQFYLVFPVILLATPARRRAIMLGGLLALCAASRVALERFAPNPFTGMLPIVAGEYLVAGAIAGFLDTTRPAASGSAARLAGSAGLSGLVALWVSGWHFGIGWAAPIIPELTALAFSMLVWELWRSRGLLCRVLSLRPLAYLGKISYGCYVLHVYAIQNVYPLLGGPRAPAKASFFVALAITLVAAMASWHLFESPILTLKTRFTYGPKAPGRRFFAPVTASRRHAPSASSAL